MRLGYGRETEFVAEKLDQASTTTLRGVRQTASWLRRGRERRRQRRGDPGAAAPPEEPAVEIEVEIIHPGTTANDRGPEPPPSPRSKARRKKRLSVLHLAKTLREWRLPLSLW